MTEEDQKAAVVAFGITVVRSAAPLVVPASFTIEEQRDRDGGDDRRAARNFGTRRRGHYKFCEIARAKVLAQVA